MTSFIQKLTGSDAKGIALRFVLMFGVISLFADFTYEGSRSIVGPYLAQLGASGTAVGIITGLGELLGTPCASYPGASPRKPALSGRSHFSAMPSR